MSDEHWLGVVGGDEGGQAELFDVLASSGDLEATHPGVNRRPHHRGRTGQGSLRVGFRRVYTVLGEEFDGGRGGGEIGEGVGCFLGEEIGLSSKFVTPQQAKSTPE